MKIHLCRDEWWPMYDEVEEKYSDITIDINAHAWAEYNEALDIVRSYQNKWDSLYEAKKT